MIEVAEGEVFLRADGHCYYEENYISRCVEALLESKAQNVGGAQRYMASNIEQAGIALAVKSFLGNGGAKYMDTNYTGFADTVFLGCFWSRELREIGGFNTDNITNQDAELNLRLIEKFGDCVYVSSDIKCWYFPRSSFPKLFKQYFRYGRGRFLTRILHPESSPKRALMPFTMLFGVSFLVFLDMLTNSNLYSIQTVLLLTFITFAESFRVSIVNNKLFKQEIWQGGTNLPSKVVVFLSCSICLVLMQFAHFSGFLYQLLKRVFKGSKGW